MLSYNPQDQTLFGTLLMCDCPTLSGTTYPKSEVIKAVDEYNIKIRNGESTSTGVQVTEVHFNDKMLNGTLKILPNEAGNKILNKIKQNIKIKGVMHAECLIKHQTVYNLHIISFDVVLT